MKKQLRILILEDNETDAELMRHQLRKGNITFESKCVETKETFEKSLEDFAPDLILADYTLPAFDGRSALRISNEKLPDVPFIFVSGTIGEDFAIESLKSGATDYVLKDRISRLASAVDRALREAEEKVEYKKAEKALKDSEEKLRLFHNLINQSNDAFLVNDPETGRILDANDKACINLGYKREELFNMRVFDFETTIPDQLSWKEHVKELRKRKSLVLEGQHRRKDGTIFPVEVNVNYVVIGNVNYMIAVARDITERKRTEEELRIKAQLLDDATDSIFVHDPKGNFIYLNQGAYTSRGFNKDEMMGMNLRRIVTPEYAKLIEPRIKKLIKDGEGTFESVHLRKDKSTMPVETHSRIIESGSRKLVLSVVRDITERKQMEDALHRKEEHFRSLIENALDTITILNKDGTIIYESPSIERVLGYKPEELTGKNAFEFVHREDLPGVMNALKIGIQNPGSTQLAEYRFKHKDGSWRVLESIGKLVLDNAESAYVIVNSRDITERKRAEEALSQSEEKYRLLIDNMQEGVFILQDGKVQFVNEAFARTAGYTVEEILGRDFLDFIAPEDKKRVIDNYSRRLAGENAPKEYELNILHKDRTRIITNVNVGIIKYRGKAASMGTIKDITERKQAEKALQYRLEFEKLITSISTNFINITSDEIDGEINRALKAIGEFTGVDRSYVFMISKDGTNIDNTHEWCADQDCSQLQNLKGLPFDSFPWFAGKMRRHETISISRIADIPPDAKVEIAALQKSPIKSLIDVPMIYGGVLFGYLGLTSVHKESTWSEDLIALLKIVGEIFVNALVRKMAEAAMWESEARFRAIFEEAAIGIVLVNMDGRAIVSNPALQEMLGYSGEELRKMAFTDFTYPDDVSANLNFFNELAAGKRDYYQMEKRYIKKDGGIIWARVTSSLIRGDDGEPQFSIGTVENITERKKAEELLKERARAELYGFIVSALPAFASGVPSQVRNILVRNFAERFERNIRPRFEEKTKQLNLYFDDGTYNSFDVFILWLSGLFSNLGIKTRTTSGGVKRSFELLNCPWKGEASGNPIFCFICRTIVIRSFTWTSLKGGADQKSSIANGSQTCRFEINVKPAMYSQGNH